MLFNYKYGGTSSVKNKAGQTAMSFAPDSLREPTFFVGQLHKKIAFREAISALNAVVVSDLRFKPRDKSAYLAWAKEQEEVWLAQYLGEIAGDEANIKQRIEDISVELAGVEEQERGVMQHFYKKQREYFNYLYKKDFDAWIVLDPVITTHPDSIFFECFSQDESTYGKLSCGYNVFKNIDEFSCGTTNIDYSAALYNEFQKIRNYKETDFRVDPSGFEIQTEDQDLYKEVKIDLPESWVRGFLQVSSAMTMPLIRFDLHPMDIHSICQLLRRFKETHGPRSLRFQLRPGQPVKVVVEPWNKEIICRRSIYHGPKAEEVRIWGRRRLLILERLIPQAKKFTVSFLGSGLPSFYEAQLEGDMVFTLGLSGWTDNDWSRAGNFDLLAPRLEVDDWTKQTVFEALKTTYFESVDSLAERLQLGTDIVSASLQAYTQAGRVIFDPTLGVYRLRELHREPLDMKLLRFASPQEEKANKILDQNRLSNLSAEAQQNGQTRLSAQIKGEQRNYQCQLLIDADDRMVQAECNCNHFQMNKLRKGPCEHILATRMAHNRKTGKLI
ncbi:SWIM zinc finger-containing protein [Saprospira grandis DSM 2844]|uniref:SWIM zinc finger-containing protein n=1 Tax=Saprospira grandis DSM 2844 TaxID=694433 RepID=J1I5I9_9BACT|nr:SWIM zinc finger family protein [Saprospira grandis]EJF54045.1 SWIM zinc finger-containing protein [Saprospira grandis DSM 2844]